MQMREAAVDATRQAPNARAGYRQPMQHTHHRIDERRVARTDRILSIKADAPSGKDGE